MRVIVEALPWLSETLGVGISNKAVLEQEVPEGTTLRGLLHRLNGNHDRFGRLVFDAERSRLTGQAEIAVNGAIYDLAGGLDAPLRDGDVVTFLPGLAGG